MTTDTSKPIIFTRKPSVAFKSVQDLCSEIIQNVPEARDNIFVCGGRVLAELAGTNQFGDTDIYVTSRSVAEKIVYGVLSKAQYGLLKPIGLSQYRYIAHLQHKHFKSELVNFIWMDDLKTIQDVINSFDFVICGVGYDPTNNVFCKHSLFDTHLADQRLGFNHSFQHRVFNSRHAEIIRILKYAQRGYVPDPEVVNYLCTELIAAPNIEQILTRGGLKSDYPSRVLL